MMKQDEQTMIRNKLFKFFILCLFLQNSAFAIQELDRIVAIVNKDPITYQDLNHGVNKALRFFELNKIDPPEQDVIEKKVLEELIEQKLIEAYAKDWNIKVQQDEVDNIIKNITDSNKISLEEFKENLNKQGSSYNDFVSSMRYEITLKKVKNREISSRLNISEFEIKKHREKLSKITPDIYDVSHILIKFSPDPTASEKKEKRLLADKILQDLNKQDFKTLAYEYSDAPDSSEGGYLGKMKKGELPEIFINNIEGLKAGDVSKVFESSNGIHIVKINNIESLGTESKGKKQLVNKYKIRQIVLKTSEVYSETDVITKLNNYKIDIENGADFTNYAKKYSEDFSSTNGGDIGWIASGYDQFLDKELSLLDVNEISNPFKTNLGWHIIQYTEMKTEDLSSESIDNQIRIDLINERTELLYQDWFANLKTEAFIEFRND